MLFENINIITIPNPILYKVAEKVTDIDSARLLGIEMLKCMEESVGVGLAAPQIGKSIRLFVASPTGLAKDGHIYINPELELEGEQQIGIEGCLSIPDVRLPIMRYINTTINYTDVSGKRIKLLANNTLSRILQHEYDHLVGRLIVQKYWEQVATFDPEPDCANGTKMTEWVKWRMRNQPYSHIDPLL